MIIEFTYCKKDTIMKFTYCEKENEYIQLTKYVIVIQWISLEDNIVGTIIFCSYQDLFKFSIK